MNMKGHLSCTSDKLDHYLSSRLAYIHLFFWLLLLFSRPTFTFFIVEGSQATCTNEGEQVPKSEFPCYTCYCKNGVIECAQGQCMSQGCYIVLPGVKQNCCRVCKGCDYNNQTYPSGSQWTNPEDPCQVLQCQGGVVTISQQQCYTPPSCETRKASFKGQCCQSFEGCQLSGVTLHDGEEVVLGADRCVRCKCQNGDIVCVKQVCPVLPCPASRVVHNSNTCCPECRGHREFFEVQGCMLSTFRAHGEKFKVDNCTTCVCNNFTSICERETCQPLRCRFDEQEFRDGECCPQCIRQPVSSACVVAGQTYKEGDIWKTNPCTTCECLNGKPSCTRDPCNPNLICPPGHKIQSFPGGCCPKCVKAFAVCTVYGDPHYRTFDRRVFDFQGSCKYVLSEDCVSRSFSVRVKNDARLTQSYSWTKSVFIKVNNTKVVLLQQAKIKVDGRVVNPPFSKQGILSITRDDYSITVATNFGMTILWNGDSFLELMVPPVFYGKLCGLCGNYNGDSLDDFKTRKGRVMSNEVLFSRAWRVGGKRFCDRPDIGTNVESSICKWDLISSSSSRQQKCAVLKGLAFQPCHQTVRYELYLKSCLLDMCECPANRQCHCDSLMAYAQECARNGIVLQWRTGSNCTGPPCHGGTVFSSCGPPCPPTCDNHQVLPAVNATRATSAVAAIKSCTLSTSSSSPAPTCVPGCFCPKGTVLHRNRCVKLEKCPRRRPGDN